MSKNYELLQKSDRAQRLYSAFLQEPASVTSDTLPSRHDTRAEICTQEERWVSPNDGGNPFDSFRLESPGHQYGEETERRIEDTASSSRVTLTEILGRGKATFRSVRGSLRSLRLAAPYPRSKSAHELALLAHEEQVKLMQRIFLSGDRRTQVVVFCGIESGIGCSSICAESAVTLAAQTPGTVCLVDANLRSPALHRIFGLKNGKGFAEAMLQCAAIREYGHQLRNLWILTSGTPTPDPFVLFTSDTLRSRMKELRDAFDFVLIDAPPVNPFADAIRMGPLTDGVILVMGANSTRREAARKATQDLRAVRARVLAAVLNRRRYPIPEALYRRL